MIDGRLIRRLVILFTTLVFGAAAVVPVTLDLMQGPVPVGIYLDEGDVWEYRPATNLPSTLSLEGDAARFATLSEDGVVSLSISEDGVWTLVVVAESERPSQRAEQEMSFVVGDQYGHTRPLFLLVPTLYFVGIVAWVARTWMRGGGDGGPGGGSFGGRAPSIAGGLRSGFGRRRRPGPQTPSNIF